MVGAVGSRAYGSRVDGSTRRFGVPDGLAVVGLFGGALVLTALAVIATTDIVTGDNASVVVSAAVVALCAVLGAGVVLVLRLRSASQTLERTTRQVEEAGSRLQVLVEHVPAAVYIDVADPDVSDGGRLAYMSPQIIGILGYRPEELVTIPELWPSRIHPDDRGAASPPTRSTGGPASPSGPSTG